YIACSENLLASITRDSSRDGIERIATSRHSTNTRSGDETGPCEFTAGPLLSQAMSRLLANSLKVAMRPTSESRNIGITSGNANLTSLAGIAVSVSAFFALDSSVPAVAGLRPRALAMAPEAAATRAWI